MIQGRVIRIFDRRSLVLNIGAADGVSSGMRFGIWTPREEIIDPETFDSLGTFRRRKATVIARTVSERFTVAASAPISRRTSSFQASLGAIVGSVEEVEVDLPVDAGDIEPLTGSPNVQIGDSAEQIPEPGQAPTPPRQPTPVQGADPLQDDEPEDDETERED